MLFLFSYNQYLHNNANNYTTETMSEDSVYLNDDSCTYRQTSCAKLIANELIGVVCVDHTCNSMVRIDLHTTILYNM